jgi:serine/threonine protein kinase
MAVQFNPLYFPTPSSMHTFPGTILQGKYEIVRRIGAGGMGEIFEARHARLSGRYAIKFLSEVGVQRPEALERFRSEALVTSALTDPGIVQVLDFDQAPDGSPFLVTHLRLSSHS